mmetsp:Transcript_34975/g.100037  ORF Transcript_34975/g.100037 Transcript_34975/m.100037 type:complete len:386 (-) Transcript_34975:56-1213(-)
MKSEGTKRPAGQAVPNVMVIWQKRTAQAAASARTSGQLSGANAPSSSQSPIARRDATVLWLTFGPQLSNMACMASALRGRVNSEGHEVTRVTNAINTTSKMAGTLLRKPGRRRISDQRVFRELKAAPTRPPRTPIRAKPIYSRGLQACECSTLNMVTPLDMPALITESVNAADTAAVNARSRVRVGKKELTSSRLKSTPPTGAPNAVETPAAAAAENNSLRLPSFWNCGQNRDRNSAQQTATCTRGPSFPRDMPAATDSARPGTLTQRVRRDTTSGMTKPLRIVLTSGMPDPAAAGAKAKTSHADMPAMSTPRPTLVQKPPRPWPQSRQPSSGQWWTDIVGWATQKPKRKDARRLTTISMSVPVSDEHTPTEMASTQACAANHHW